MKNFLKSIAFTVVLSMALPMSAADTVAPVRMGAGAMTFDTVPGWGLGEDGKSVIGPTHGGVVIDKAGNIYTSADKGVFVFSPDGKVVRRFVGDEYSRIHDMEIREEAEGEFIYGARNANAEGIKFNARHRRDRPEAAVPQRIRTGPEEVQSRRRSPSLPTATSFCPTATPATHLQVRQDRQVPDALRQQRERPEAIQHGPRHDARHALRAAPPADLRPQSRAEGTPAALRPGRQLHRRSRHRPGDADLGRGPGRLRLGARPARAAGDPGQEQHDHRRARPQSGSRETGGNYNVPQEQWIEGVFSGTHGSYWDKDGNLYVQDWNVSGRIMKLVRSYQVEIPGAMPRLSHCAALRQTAPAHVRADGTKPG